MQSEPEGTGARESAESRVVDVDAVNGERAGMQGEGPEAIDDATLRMALAEGVGPVFSRRLLERFGSADAVVNASVRELALVESVGPLRAEQFRRAFDAASPDAERRAMARSGARLLRLGRSEYPQLLAAIADPPAVLWVRGELQADDALAVAVVGSRRCTSYGREQAMRLAFALAEVGLTVISGGARGIDAAAHRAALRAGGRTVAVLGCGLGHCYPAEHAELFDEIARAGAVVSEFPTSMGPRPEFFPRRNRIISGLSLGVVVIEAASRSGALVTAREAVESHHREVMALPGPVDSPTSVGCHRAIREGWAGLVTGAKDVITQLEPAIWLLRALPGGIGGGTRATQASSRGAGPCPAAPRSLSDGDCALLDALPATGRARADELAMRVARPIGEVLAALTTLEIAGLITRDQLGFRRRPDGPKPTGAVHPLSERGKPGE